MKKSIADYKLILLASVFSFAPLLPSTLEADLSAGSATYDSFANQTVRVTDGSPLTDSPFNIPAGTEFDLSALGSFSVDWDAESGGTANVSAFSAVYNELHPALGPYQILATGIGPGASFSGALSNIVDDAGILVSADLSLSTTFSLTFLAPGLGEQTLYTKEQATFTGTLLGGNSGFVLSSPEDLNVFLSLGDVDTDPLSAVSFNRTVIVSAVPEPSSLLLAFVGLVGVACRRRR